jgi:hypothetical protein
MFLGSSKTPAMEAHLKWFEKEWKLENAFSENSTQEWLLL